MEGCSEALLTAENTYKYYPKKPSLPVSLVVFALISLISVFLLCLLLFSWLSCWAAMPGIDELCMQEVSASFTAPLFSLPTPRTSALLCLLITREYWEFLQHLLPAQPGNKAELRGKGNVAGLGGLHNDITDLRAAHFLQSTHQPSVQT